jgi:hypothetical protein|tara:strand:- start:707 stop:1354 length:648 start_codon:yes stop_codon:yes gene_type:complete
MSFTYSTLKSAIENYADNTETTFVANLDNFIKAAEQRILNSIDLQYFRKNVTGTVTSGNQYLAVPSDYLASFSLSVVDSSNKEFLLEKDVNYIQSVNPNSATTGVPKYYAYFDINNFILAPTPSANAVAELHYFYRPASLTAAGDSGTTWLSTNAPNAMLYGSLVEAYIYMKGEPDVMKSYTDRFMESLVRLKDYGEARENSDAYRRGLPTRERS